MGSSAIPLQSAAQLLPFMAYARHIISYTASAIAHDSFVQDSGLAWHAILLDALPSLAVGLLFWAMYVLVSSTKADLANKRGPLMGPKISRAQTGCLADMVTGSQACLWH